MNDCYPQSASPHRCPLSQIVIALFVAMSAAFGLLAFDSTPVHAQSSEELARYSQQLRSVAQTLEKALDDACCNANGEHDTVLLVQEYLAAAAMAEEALIVPADGSAVLTAASLLDADLKEELLAIQNDDEENPDLPEAPALLDAIEATVARLTLVADQIDRMDQDQTSARLAVLEEVLARSDFQTQLSWWERFTRWLSELWRAYFPETEGDGILAGTLGRIVGWALGIAGLIAAVVLLVYWLQSLLGGFASGSSIAANAGAEDDYPVSAQQARAQAIESAKVGNYRSAVRQLYLSALLTMEEEGTIDYDRSQTNREVLAQVDGNSPISSHLRPVINTFDDVWYGIQEPDQETYAGYMQEVDQLTQAAASSEPANRAETANQPDSTKRAGR